MCTDHLNHAFPQNTPTSNKHTIIYQLLAPFGQLIVNRSQNGELSEKQRGDLSQDDMLRDFWREEIGVEWHVNFNSRMIFTG